MPYRVGGRRPPAMWNLQMESIYIWKHTRRHDDTISLLAFLVFHSSALFVLVAPPLLLVSIILHRNVIRAEGPKVLSWPAWLDLDIHTVHIGGASVLLLVGLTLHTWHAMANLFINKSYFHREAVHSRRSLDTFLCFNKQTNKQMFPFHNFKALCFFCNAFFFSSKTLFLSIKSI
jgi:hypothetical protein